MDTTAELAVNVDIDTIQSLLRGELSAVETYTQAIKKFEDSEVISDLQELRAEHDKAVRKLRDHVVRFGGTPTEDSGAWGTFAKAVTGVAKAMGSATALAALRRGEEHGIGLYKEALDRETLPPECEGLIRAELMPACRVHVARLDALIQRVEG